jgi:hypothetical protein
VITLAWVSVVMRSSSYAGLNTGSDTSS